MKVIGITGGVGAGKSEVLAFLSKHYNCRVIMADKAAHQLEEPGGRCFEPLISLLGADILTSEGRIDRQKMAAKIFSDAALLKKVNAIVHPAVKKEILRRIAWAEAEGKACAVVEAALFLEEKYDAFCSETWYIYTNEDRRRARLKVSRGYTDERIDQMFQSQKSHEEFLGRCDYVIDNNGTAEETCRQIDRRMMNR